MKKALLLLMTLAMLLTFASCKNNEDPDKHFKDPTENVTDTEGEGATSPTEPSEDPENIKETPKVPFDEIVNSKKDN